jgi:hypothetical protein
MRHKRSLCHVLFGLGLLQLASTPQLYSQAWSGILDPTRAIDWTQAGVPGGIPSGSWSQCGSTIAAGASAATINAALSGCAASHYVLLGPGTFNMSSGIAVPSNVVLRGSGADQTILNMSGSGNAAVTMGSGGGVGYSGALAITAGATNGSTSITLSGTAGVSVGKLMVVSEVNTGIVTNAGGEGTCTWCDGWSTNGSRARGQIVKVVSVSGTSIGISPGLYGAYTNSPTVVPFSPFVQMAGVENLQVKANNTGWTNNFGIYGCDSCWIKGVEANYTDGDFAEVGWSFHTEIRDSYFSNAYNHAPGSTDSDVFIDYKTSASKIENNIIERGHASIMLNWGAAGNVVAYNYTTGEFDAGSTNFVIGGISMHGAHPQYNLIEGNVADMLYADQVWGSSGYNTTFRNWFEGTTRACNPTSGRGTVNCTGSGGWWTFQASRAMQISHTAQYFSFVGDIAGSANQQSLLSYGNPTTHVAILAYPSSRTYDSVNYNFTFGYGESGDDGSGDGCSGGTGPCHGTEARSTSLIYKAFTVANGAVNCSTGGSASTCASSLPASFYLSGKPSWWGTAPFPAIGPDITGGPGASGHAYLTPAQNCYQNVMGGSEGGGGSPLTFNANACYASSSTASQPSPPTNLSASSQ